MALYDRATGTLVEEQEYGGGALFWLYKTFAGRVLLKLVAAAPWVSRLRGYYQKSGRSRKDIRPFIRQYDIDLTDGGLGTGWKAEDFANFNDFFTRQRDYNAYYADLGADWAAKGGTETCLPAVADARLSVFPIRDDLTVTIKNSTYHIGELVGGLTRKQPYYGGNCLVFRLAVTDYHRYVFPDSGRILEAHFIPGELHTVRPISEKYRVYARNTRAVTVMETEHFGTMTQVEVGAMLVGHIVNHPTPQLTFRAGREKGYFEFGGSTIVLLTGPDVVIDEDILTQSAAGNEVKVKLGEKIGSRK